MEHAEAMRRLEIALAHHQAHRPADAERIYREVLAASPNQPDALHLLGVLLAQRGQPNEALPLLQRAVAIGPQVGEFHRHHGEVLQMLGRQGDALAAFGRALQIDPNDIQSRGAAGAVLLAIGQVAQAADQFRFITRCAPNDAINWGNYGHVLAKLGRSKEALDVFQHALKIDPNSATVLMQYAEAIWRTGDYDNAVAPARQAAAMMPNEPRVLIMFGNTLQTAGELVEAEQVYRRATELDDTSFDAHSNLALTVLKLGDAATALKLYDRIVQRWPTNTDAKANRSLAMLTLGDFERGFAEYEARWASPQFAGIKHLGVRWDGGDVRGQTVLLTSEQGHGDTIQFVRYASLLADRGANAIVSCPADLVGIVSTVPGVSRVIVAKQESAKFDCFAPLASLPRLFKTTQEAVPADVPYMRPDPTLVQRWRDQIGQEGLFKVGIVWAGSPQHQNDKVRSAKFSHFTPLADIANVKLYSLQKGSAANDVDERAVPLGDQLTDYAQTAALLENLDLVISVDTSIVHLAGALARPVWTLLAKGPDWRWMLDREDSPWYPTMRLFRQTTLHDWDSVMERVVRKLVALVETRGPAGRR